MARPGGSDDLAFYQRLQVQGAITARPPATLRDAASESTAVVVAGVRDVVLSRTIVGDTARDQVAVVGVVLAAPRVVRER